MRTYLVVVGSDLNEAALARSLLGLANGSGGHRFVVAVSVVHPRMVVRELGGASFGIAAGDVGCFAAVVRGARSRLTGLLRLLHESGADVEGGLVVGDARHALAWAGAENIDEIIMIADSRLPRRDSAAKVQHRVRIPVRVLEA